MVVSAIVVLPLIMIGVFADEPLEIDSVDSPTNQNPLIVSGKGAFGDANVKVLLDGEEKVEGFSDGEGKFSVETPLTEEREYKITVKSFKGEDVRESSNELSTVYDSTPPGSLSLSNFSKESIVIDEDGGVEVKVKGSVGEESVVKLFKDGDEIDSRDTEEGTFVFEDISVKSGKSNFYLTAEDEAGNISEKSNFSGVIVGSKVAKYKTVTKETDKLDQGTSKVTTKGENGEKVVVYVVVYSGSKAKGKKVIAQRTIEDPVNQVKQIGTRIPAASQQQPESPKTSPYTPDPPDPTVYTTNTGSKYHSAGCQYLSKSCIPIKLSAAKARGLTPCSRCSPPR